MYTKIRTLTKTTTDIELIKDIRKGNKESFTQLYKRYYRLHMLTCLRYVKNRPEAEDLLQEACIKIFKDLHQFDPEKGKYINWSNRVTINVCLQYLRKNNILSNFDNIVDIKEEKFSEQPKAIENLNLKDLTDLIVNLPKGYRTIFNMYVVDGFNHREIAEQLGITENTSKTQLMKARKALRFKISQTEKSQKGNYA